MDIKLKDPDKKIIEYLADNGQTVATTDDGKKWKLVHLERDGENLTLKFEEMG